VGAIVAVMGVGIFSGCASPGEPAAPRVHAAAARERSGQEAYLLGHASEAVPALSDAVKLYLNAGDAPAACRAMLNLALAQRAAGDASGAAATAANLRDLTPAARQQVRERNATGASRPHLSAGGEEAGLTAQLDWLQALLALDRGELDAAENILLGPMENGKASGWDGRIATLRAEVALRRGKFDEALTHAHAGFAASAGAHDRAEQARASRLAGKANLQLKKWDAARKDFLAAVRIEESLGGGARMTDDLMQLAVVARELGDAGEAQLYEQRARAIAGAQAR
jgi:tetratricopeptide (TPR) repeat protein